MAVKKRYTVLSYIFGTYEKLHEVEYQDPDADYVMVTDNPGLKSDTWRIVLLTDRNLSVFGKCYTVRFHPYDFISTDIVLRIDGSIGIKQSLQPLIDEFERGKYDRCLMIHPHRSTQPLEYNAWVRCRDYSPNQAGRCMIAMERMSSHDFVQNYKGMYQGCFEIQRNNEVNRQINDMTFGLLCLLGKGAIERLDQTVTSFVINRFYSDRLKVLPVSEDIVTDGNLMQWYLHNSDRPVTQRPNTTDLMLFNKPCTVWKPTMNKKKVVHEQS